MSCTSCPQDDVDVYIALSLTLILMVFICYLELLLWWQWWCSRGIWTCPSMFQCPDLLSPNPFWDWSLLFGIASNVCQTHYWWCQMNVLNICCTCFYNISELVSEFNHSIAIFCLLRQHCECICCMYRPQICVELPRDNFSDFIIY